MKTMAIDISQVDAALANQDVKSLANLIMSASGKLVEKLNYAESSYSQHFYSSLQQLLTHACVDQKTSPNATASIRGNSFIKPVAVYGLRHELEYIRDAFLGVAMTKRIDLSLSFGDYSEIVFWDLSSLRTHVFNILLTNILCNVPIGSSVTIFVQKLDEYSMLIKISASTLEEEAFPPQQQLNGASLSNVQHCIAAHKGKFSIVEERGVGSTYQIELPLFSLCIQ